MWTPYSLGLLNKYCLDALITIILCLSSFFTHAETITMLSIDYPPYTGRSLPQEGIITAITRAAFQRMGYTVKIEYKPWARAIQEVKKGSYAGILDVWHSEDRTAFLAYSKPLLLNVVGFYARANQQVDVHDLSKLGSLTIGKVRGNLDPPNFAAAHLNTDEAVDDTNNLLKLAAGRVDLVLMDKRVADYILQNQLKNLRDKLVWLDPPVYRFWLYIAFSKNSPNWERHLADFNSGLALIQADGALERLKNALDR